MKKQKTHEDAPGGGRAGCPGRVGWARAVWEVAHCITTEVNDGCGQPQALLTLASTTQRLGRDGCCTAGAEGDQERRESAGAAGLPACVRRFPCWASALSGRPGCQQLRGCVSQSRSSRPPSLYWFLRVSLCIRYICFGVVLPIKTKSFVKS